MEEKWPLLLTQGGTQVEAETEPGRGQVSQGSWLLGSASYPVSQAVG